MADARWVVGVVCVLVVAYLLGSIPTGYLVGRAIKGIDIRQFGSGSTGATNVLRTLGKGPAIFVLLVDVIKGVGAIALVRWVYGTPTLAVPPMIEVTSWVPWVITFAGLMALIGHSRSIWLRFGGGKSVATGLGVLLAMHWPTAILAILVFVVSITASRIVSLSSITTAIAVPIMMLTMKQPLPFLLFGVAAAAYIVMRHRANMQRIMAGTEPRLGQKLEHRSPEIGS
jgi:glycerol-3-phosphate acyltransferase PlsY